MDVRRLGPSRYFPRHLGIVVGLIITTILAACGDNGETRVDEPVIGDAPALRAHTSQTAIDNRVIDIEELVDIGEMLFATSFNTLDGAGRPETTDISASNFRPRRVFPDNFNRISGPDANSCLACHNLPRSAGGGDNAANVFLLANELPFVNFDGAEGDDFREHTLKTVGVERSAIGIFGSGYIELLAREMTVDLEGIVTNAREEAKGTGSPVSRDLLTKGVSFGRITARPDGTLDTSQVEGVDDDLVIKPFMQKGVVVSLREFAVKAMNQHFGMQASENFGDGLDADRDGVIDELSRGDLTALVIFQATLPVPGQLLPAHAEAQAAVERGRVMFSTLGCNVCHIPELRLETPIFTEPNPFNPPGKLQATDVSNPFAVDLTSEGPLPRLRAQSDGSVMVPAFTDLKRHDMGPQLNNDVLEQNGVPTNEWLTRKLWGFANEPPYLHHGRATLISEAILVHGGDAQEARDAFDALSADDQAAVVEFLKTLQVLPEESTSPVITAGETNSGGLTNWGAIGGGIGAALLVLAALGVFAVIRRRPSKVGDAD